MSERWIKNTETTVNSTVDKFIELLLEKKYLTIQPYCNENDYSQEMFTARLINGMILVGNTSPTPGNLNIPVIFNYGVIADFDRLTILYNFVQLKVYLRKLIRNWVDDAIAEGRYFYANRSKEEEERLILADMIFWDESGKKATACDPNDKVNTYWISARKTEEDQTKLFM